MKPEYTELILPAIQDHKVYHLFDMQTSCGMGQGMLALA